MCELKFTSNCSMDEIDNRFRDVDLFEGIMSGLDEGLAFKNGNATSETISRKSTLPEINVADLRCTFGITQKAFASILGVSTRTVEAWEAGRSNPTPTARKLMFLLKQDASLIQKL